MLQPINDYVNDKTTCLSNEMHHRPVLMGIMILCGLPWFFLSIIDDKFYISNQLGFAVMLLFSHVLLPSLVLMFIWFTVCNYLFNLERYILDKRYPCSVPIDEISCSEIVELQREAKERDAVLYYRSVNQYEMCFEFRFKTEALKTFYIMQFTT